VDHTPLSPNATVTGGSLSLRTVLHGASTTVGGSITGGQVVRTNPGVTGCVNQNYAVTLVLGSVGPNGAGSGTGSFAGRLTHYRQSIFGTCVTYSATISGSMSLTF
jgi:hypothetical protein